MQMSVRAAGPDMHFTVVSMAGCPWCQRARVLIRKMGGTYTNKYGGAESYPQIYHGNKRIGGYDDLVAWFGLRPHPEAHQKRRSRACYPGEGSYCVKGSCGRARGGRF